LVKRGLLVSYYFPPVGGGGVQRWLKLLKYISGFGWEFTVITNNQTHSSPEDKTLLQEIPQNVKIIRTQSSGTVETFKSKTPFLKNSGYWQRWASAFFHITDSRSYWNDTSRTFLKEEIANSKYDVIIFTLPPYSLAILASELVKEVKCPVILDMRDPWTINPYKIYPTPLHRFLDERREVKSISKLSFLISAYESTFHNYRKRIPNFDSKKILVLPNGYDESDFKEIKSAESFHGSTYNLGFLGSVYSHLNTPHAIFEAIEKLKQEKIDVHFHHIGTSVYDLLKLAKKYGIEESIHTWGYTDHKRSLQILQNMDAVCLILDDRWPRSEYTIGGKFYEYLRLKKPIFALVPEEGEAARIIKNTNSGIVLSARDNDQIVLKLRSLLLEKQQFSWEGIEAYSRERQASVLNEFLNQII